MDTHSIYILEKHFNVNVKQFPSITEKLPVDVIGHLFTFLDLTSLILTSRTCKSLHSIAQTHFFSKDAWKESAKKNVNAYAKAKIEARQIELKAQRRRLSNLSKMYEKLEDSSDRNFYPTHQVTFYGSAINELDRLLPPETTSLSNYAILKEYSVKSRELESQMNKAKRKMCCFMTCKTAAVIYGVAFAIFGIVVIVHFIVMNASSQPSLDSLSDTVSF